jgi:hypothetical protein
MHGHLKVKDCIRSLFPHYVRTFLLTKPRARKVFAVPSVFHADLLCLISLQLWLPFEVFVTWVTQQNTDLRFSFLVKRNSETKQINTPHTIAMTRQMSSLSHSSLYVLHFVFPAWRPHVVEFARTTNKAEQSWRILIPSHLLSKDVLIPGGAGHQSHYSDWAMGWTTEKSWLQSPQGEDIFLDSKKCPDWLGRYSMAIGGQLFGVKGPGREADHSPPSGTEVKNERSYTFTPHPPSYTFVAYTGTGWLYLLPVYQDRTNHTLTGARIDGWFGLPF